VHELSIANSVVRVASEQAGGRRVTKVWLRVGHLRQVVPSAFAFAFELVAQGTPIEGAELVMEDVPATVCCRQCGSESALHGFPAACERCRSVDVEVMGGQELLVEALELEEWMTDGADDVGALPIGARGGER
jgi:hydrogenase nickel incorporation protein HypA/HybF